MPFGKESVICGKRLSCIGEIADVSTDPVWLSAALTD
jgi:hypothetical protein